MTGYAYVTSPVFAPSRSRIGLIMCTGGDCGDPLQPTGIGSIWKVRRDGTGLEQVIMGTRETLLPANNLDGGVNPS